MVNINGMTQEMKEELEELARARTVRLLVMGIVLKPRLNGL